MDWAREWSKDNIDEDNYVNFINKTAYNKRKSIHQKNKKLEHKKDDQEIQSKSPIKLCGTIQLTLKKQKQHSGDSTQKFPNDLLEKVCQPVHQEQQPSLQSDRSPIPQHKNGTPVTQPKSSQ